MSRNAARAMNDLADALEEEAKGLPPGMAYATLQAMARAHRRAADRIEAWSADGATPSVPPEFIGGAGQKPTARS